MNTHDLLDLATMPGNDGQQRLAETRLLSAVLRHALEDINDYRFATEVNARRITVNVPGNIAAGLTEPWPVPVITTGR